MDMELLHGQMDKNMLENGKKINIMDKGYTIMGMEEVIKVSGKIMN